MRIGGTARIASLAGLVVVAATFALPARAALLIDVDKSAQRMTVTRDGEMLYTWPVSTGGGGYDTPSGTFKPNRMDADHYSDEYDAAPMPHAIFFDEKGHAIHGSYEKRNLGSAVSHGCVRLSPQNAAILFTLVKKEGMANTRVNIEGRTTIARRSHPATTTGSASQPRARITVSRDEQPLGILPPPAYRPTTRETYMAPMRPPAGIGNVYDDDVTAGLGDDEMLPPVRARESTVLTYPLSAPHYHDRYRYYHRYD
jgi:hypothetical protein